MIKCNVITKEKKFTNIISKLKDIKLNFSLKKGNRTFSKGIEKRIEENRIKLDAKGYTYQPYDTLLK